VLEAEAEHRHTHAADFHLYIRALREALEIVEPKPPSFRALSVMFQNTDRPTQMIDDKTDARAGIRQRRDLAQLLVIGPDIESQPVAFQFCYALLEARIEQKMWSGRRYDGAPNRSAGHRRSIADAAQALLPAATRASRTASTRSPRRTSAKATTPAATWHGPVSRSTGILVMATMVSTSPTVRRSSGPSVRHPAP
jgi:hypothetical protein